MSAEGINSLTYKEDFYFILYFVSLFVSVFFVVAVFCLLDLMK